MAEFYEAAVRMVNGEFPGRPALVAHCVREMTNRLPDYFSGAVASRKADYKSLVDDLAGEWQASGLAASSPTVDGPIIESTVTISVRLLECIGNLFREHGAASERGIDKKLRMLSIGSPDNQPTVGPNDPSVKQWFRCHKWFMKIVHDPGPALSLDRRQDRRDALPIQFDVFESLLYSVLGGYFKNVTGLDDILASANKTGD